MKSGSPFPLFKRLVASMSACAYFAANVVLLHAEESNLWADRRLELSRVTAPASGASTVLPAMERISRSPRDLPSAVPASLPSGLAEKHAALFRALPASCGTVRQVLVPSGAASGKVIVHIQDAHQNQEAQRNIGRAVQSLLDAETADLIALEGAFSPVDVSRYRAFQDQTALRKAADHLLAGNCLSGPLHAAFTSARQAPPIVGVDDPVHYAANVEAYRRSAPRAAGAKNDLDVRVRAAEDGKKKAFNPDLLAFDQKVRSYREGSSSFGDHVRALAPAAGQAARFREALDMESALDFAAVEADRSRLIGRLAAVLRTAQLDELSRWSLAFRAGEMGSAPFYGRLRDLCRTAGINLSEFKAMDAYIRYVLAADRIDADGLLQEIDALERERYAALARTDQERSLIVLSRHLHLAGKLVDFALTPQEWSQYEASAPSGSGPAEPVDLSSFEDFYREAHARDEAMTARLTAEMAEREAGAAVLVTGGYHAPGMGERLRRAGFTVVSFVPKIEAIHTTAGTTYLSVFTREKTPLEKMFQGEKLFLSPEQFPPALNVTMAALTAVFAGLGQGARRIEELFRALIGELVQTRVRESKKKVDFTLTDPKTRRSTELSVLLDPNGGVSGVIQGDENMFWTAAFSAFTSIPWGRAALSMSRWVLEGLFWPFLVLGRRLSGPSRGYEGWPNEVYSPSIRRAVSAGDFSAVDSELNSTALWSDKGGFLPDKRFSQEQLRLLRTAYGRIPAAEREILRREEAVILFIPNLDAQVGQEMRRKHPGRAPPESGYGSHYGLSRPQYYFDARILSTPNRFIGHLVHEVREKQAILDGLRAKGVIAPNRSVSSLGSSERSRLAPLIESLAVEAHRRLKEEEDAAGREKRREKEKGDQEGAWSAVELLREKIRSFDRGRAAKVRATLNEDLVEHGANFVEWAVRAEIKQPLISGRRISPPNWHGFRVAFTRTIATELRHVAGHNVPDARWIFKYVRRLLANPESLTSGLIMMDPDRGAAGLYRAAGGSFRLYFTFPSPSEIVFLSFAKKEDTLNQRGIMRTQKVRELQADRRAGDAALVRDQSILRELWDRFGSDNISQKLHSQLFLPLRAAGDVSTAAEVLSSAHGWFDQFSRLDLLIDSARLGSGEVELPLSEFTHVSRSRTITSPESARTFLLSVISNWHESASAVAAVVGHEFRREDGPDFSALGRLYRYSPSGALKQSVEKEFIEWTRRLEVREGRTRTAAQTIQQAASRIFGQTPSSPSAKNPAMIVFWMILAVTGDTPRGRALAGKWGPLGWIIFEVPLLLNVSSGLHQWAGFWGGTALTSVFLVFFAGLHVVLRALSGVKDESPLGIWALFMAAFLPYAFVPSPLSILAGVALLWHFAYDFGIDVYFFFKEFWQLTYRLPGDDASIGGEALATEDRQVRRLLQGYVDLIRDGKSLFLNRQRTGLDRWASFVQSFPKPLSEPLLKDRALLAKFVESFYTLHQMATQRTGDTYGAAEETVQEMWRILDEGEPLVPATGARPAGKVRDNDFRALGIEPASTLAAARRAFGKRLNALETELHGHPVGTPENTRVAQAVKDLTDAWLRIRKDFEGNSRGQAGWPNEVYGPAIQKSLNEGNFRAVDAWMAPVDLWHDGGDFVVGQPVSPQQLVALRRAISRLPQAEQMALVKDGSVFLFIPGLDASVSDEIARRYPKQALPGSGSHYGLHRPQYYFDGGMLENPEKLARHLLHEIQERRAVLDGLRAANALPADGAVPLRGTPERAKLDPLIDKLAQEAHDRLLRAETKAGTGPAAARKKGVSVLLLLFSGAGFYDLLSVKSAIAAPAHALAVAGAGGVFLPWVALLLVAALLPLIRFWRAERGARVPVEESDGMQELLPLAESLGLNDWIGDRPLEGRAVLTYIVSREELPRAREMARLFREFHRDAPASSRRLLLVAGEEGIQDDLSALSDDGGVVEFLKDVRPSASLGADFVRNLDGALRAAAADLPAMAVTASPGLPWDRNLSGADLQTLGIAALRDLLAKILENLAPPAPADFQKVMEALRSIAQHA